jgi:two-component system, sensor histidine kinase and response regulator
VVSPMPSRSMRMLVAEDNKINQKLMTTLLERKGHLVTLAETGKEAVDLVEHQQFDLLLMDMQMPEMDGLEAARLIREREQGTGRHLHIIAITASAMVGDKERCLAAGMDDYISKPIDANHLYSVIESLANARPPAVSTAATAVAPGVAAS